LREEGRTVVLATHDVELAAHVADRIVLVGEGEVLADGTSREVMSESLAFSSQVSKLFRGSSVLTVEDLIKR